MDTNEGKIVDHTTSAITSHSIAQDLNHLGVKPGHIVLVHSSLSKLGWVCGGSVGVILGLLQAVGETGTLVMPSHSGDLSDPKRWQNPPVPEDWWPVIYKNMPAYRPDLTPTRGMGAVPETFRKMQGVIRSAHPQLSFCAYGPMAEQITDGHELAHGLGENSPLARLYDLDGWVLLLGVGHANNTSLHLAETRAEFAGKKIVRSGAPVFVGDVRHWVEFDEVDYHEEDFTRLGEDFRKETGMQIIGRVGAAEALLMPQRTLVDYAVNWLEKHRQ